MYFQLLSLSEEWRREIALVEISDWEKILSSANAVFFLSDSEPIL